MGGIGAPRVPLVDAGRGLAIVAMVVFHVGWDAWYLGFFATDVTQDPAWVAFQRGIVAAFLFLVGVSLVLAHGEGIRWRGFWRRFGLILGGALLTSIGTFLVFPDYFVYFGILHAIAAFSLAGLAFVRAPVWLVALAVPVLVLPPALLSHPAMGAKPLSWIGFFPEPPMTTDIVPVFPWFGAVLAGILATRLLVGTPLWEALARPRLSGPLGRALRWLGRWSLLIYLLHQPVIFGTMSLFAPAAPDTVAFVHSCEQGCRESGDALFCARYCLCALEQIEAQSLWDDIAAIPQPPEVAAMTRLCTLMAAD